MSVTVVCDLREEGPIVLEDSPGISQVQLMDREGGRQSHPPDQYLPPPPPEGAPEKRKQVV